MFVRGLIGALIGALGGAGAGALTLGLDASLTLGSTWIGPARDWWPFAAVAGAVGGSVLGLVLGLYISLAGVGPRSGVIAGSIVGLVGAAVLLQMNFDDAYWHMRSLPSRMAPLLLSLLIWSLIGLIISIVAAKLSPPRWR